MTTVSSVPAPMFGALIVPETSKLSPNVETPTTSRTPEPDTVFAVTPFNVISPNSAVDPLIEPDEAILPVELIVPTTCRLLDPEMVVAVTPCRALDPDTVRLFPSVVAPTACKVLDPEMVPETCKSLPSVVVLTTCKVLEAEIVVAVTAFSVEEPLTLRYPYVSTPVVN